MLNAFYATLFKPGDMRFSQSTAILGPAIGLMVVLVLALNTAGRLHFGTGGLIALVLLFLGAGLVGLFWLTAALTLSTHLLGGQGNVKQTGQAITKGLWPLLLSGAAIATLKISVSLGLLFSSALLLGTLVTVTGSIRQAHQFNWLQASTCLLITLSSSCLALLGVLVWPLMLVLGT